MGWFSRNSSETTQQFGGMTNGMAAQQQPWGAGPAMGSGMNGIDEHQPRNKRIHTRHCIGKF